MLAQESAKSGGPLRRHADAALGRGFRSQRFINMSQARVYANVNSVRPKEYWDYEALHSAFSDVVSFSVVFDARRASIDRSL